jgi:hypothetical protein
MADIKFLVTIDSKSGQAQLKEFSDTIDGLGKSADGTKGKHDALGKNVKESIGIFGGAKEAFLKHALAFATGQGIYMALEKAGRAVLGMFKDSVKGAAESEQSENELATAIESTGRKLTEMFGPLKEYGVDLSRTTRFTDEQYNSSAALLVQMTDLDEKGIKAAMRGSAGLAAVMKTDLQTATMAVMKAMEGNTAGLGRYGIKVAESLSPQQKQVELLRQLNDLYPRASAETQTWAGRLEMLKKQFGEIQEGLGGAITKNETFKKLIEDLTKSVNIFIDSGQLDEWADRVSVAISGLIETVKVLKGALGGGFLGEINALVDHFTGFNDKVRELRSQGVADVKAFQGSLQVLKPTVAELRVEIEKGPAAWEKYKASLKSTDDMLTKNQGAITAWMKKGLEWVGVVGKQRVAIEGIHGPLKSIGITLGQQADDQFPRWRVEMATGIAYAQREYPALANTVMIASRNMFGTMMFVSDKMGSAALPVKKAWEQAAREIAQAWESTMQQIQQAVSNVTGQIGAIAQQGYTNQVTRIENEYAMRKRVVLATVKDEKEKNAQLEVLDQKMELEKRGAMRRYAAIQKAVALANAVVNTAEGVTKALASAPPPFNVILAAITAALGAVQIGLIAKQPLPLAKGAIFNRRTLLTAETGSQYEVAEAGEPEILSSPRQLRQAIAGAGRGAGERRQQPLHIHNKIYFGATMVKEEILQVIVELDDLGKLKLRRAVA